MNRLPRTLGALAALVASGLRAGEFTFLGFLPEKAGARRSRQRRAGLVQTQLHRLQPPDLVGQAGSLLELQFARRRPRRKRAVRLVRQDHRSPAVSAFTTARSNAAV